MHFSGCARTNRSVSAHQSSRRILGSCRRQDLKQERELGLPAFDPKQSLTKRNKYPTTRSPGFSCQRSCYDSFSTGNNSGYTFEKVHCCVLGAFIVGIQCPVFIAGFLVVLFRLAELARMVAGGILPVHSLRVESNDSSRTIISVDGIC